MYDFFRKFSYTFQTLFIFLLCFSTSESTYYYNFDDDSEESSVQTQSSAQTSLQFFYREFNGFYLKTVKPLLKGDRTGGDFEFFLDLPYDMKFDIASYLSPKTLLNLSEASREMNALAQTPLLLEKAGLLIIIRDKRELEGADFYGAASYKNSNTKPILIRDHSITDKHLSTIQGAPVVTLKNCHFITNFGLIYLQDIKRVILDGCLNITDGGLCYLQNAEHVSLRGCYKITGSALINLERARYIELGGDSRITNKDVRSFLEITKKNPFVTIYPD